MAGWKLIFFVMTWNLLVSSESLLSERENLLRCVCTAQNCLEAGEAICTTAGLCYTQFLDRKDGSDPLTKGCVNRKTPLLCENRRPKSRKVAILWPILYCCHTDMCNSGDLPENLQSLVIADLLNSSASDIVVVEDDLSGGNEESNQKRNTLSNPAVVAIFSVGLVALLAIGVTGCCVLQRQEAYAY